MTWEYTYFMLYFIQKQSVWLIAIYLFTVSLLKYLKTGKE